MRTIAVVLTILATLIAAPALAAPSEEQLAAAALTPDEVGMGFTAVQAGAADQLSAFGVASYLGVYQRVSPRTLSFDLVIVLLMDAAAAGQLDGQDAADNLELLRQLGMTLTPATPPAIGEDTAMYTISGAVLGFPVTGDVIAWRQGDVLALVSTMSSGAATAVGYAEQQRDKLAAIGQ